MRVAILCECSGIVRDAFIRLGHDAISVDLKPTRAPGPHIVGSIFDHDWSGFDLVIAHPPCTYLSVSGLHWNKRRPDRAAKTAEAIEFFRKVMSIDCPRLAIENPVGCISTVIRPPDQYVQPYEFGADASKKTGLWLRGLPPLKPTLYIPPRMVNGRPRWANQTDSGQNKLGPSEDRAELRSNTYPGIAEAMATQWTI